MCCIRARADRAYQQKSGFPAFPFAHRNRLKSASSGVVRDRAIDGGDADGGEHQSVQRSRGRVFLLGKRQCHFSRLCEIWLATRESHGLHRRASRQRGCPDVKVSVGIRQSLKKCKASLDLRLLSSWVLDLLGGLNARQTLDWQVHPEYQSWYTIAARLIILVQCPDGLVIGDFWFFASFAFAKGWGAFCGAVTCISRCFVPKDWIRHSGMPTRREEKRPSIQCCSSTSC